MTTVTTSQATSVMLLYPILLHDINELFFITSVGTYCCSHSGHNHLRYVWLNASIDTLSNLVLPLPTDPQKIPLDAS